MDKPSIIAVVGVSNKPEKFAYKIFTDLAKAGYTVYGVHPLAGVINGKKIYQNLSQLPVVPQLVITVVMPQVTEKVVQECAKLGVKEVWMQPGSESSAAVKFCQENNIEVTYNACIMVEKGIW